LIYHEIKYIVLQNEVLGAQLHIQKADINMFVLLGAN